MFIPKISMFASSQDLSLGLLREVTGTKGSECEGVVNMTGYGSGNIASGKVHRILFGEYRIGKDAPVPLAFESTTEGEAQWKVRLQGDGTYYIFMGLLKIYDIADTADYIEGEYLWDDTAGLAVRWVQGATLPVDSVPADGYYAIASSICPFLRASFRCFQVNMDKAAMACTCEEKEQHLQIAAEIMDYMTQIELKHRDGDELGAQLFIQFISHLCKDC